MKTCNDCIHCEACISQVPRTFWDSETFYDGCKYFKDKSGFIEIPCKVGDTVYIKGEPVKISFLHIENEITYCVQFDCEKFDCFSCPFYEDEVLREGEHDCRTYGYVEFTESDIGKTVFLTREEAEKALNGREQIKGFKRNCPEIPLALDDGLNGQRGESYTRR